jgi:hypothetical protein
MWRSKKREHKKKATVLLLVSDFEKAEVETGTGDGQGKFLCTGAGTGICTEKHCYGDGTIKLKKNKQRGRHAR